MFEIEIKIILPFREENRPTQLHMHIPRAACAKEWRVLVSRPHLSHPDLHLQIVLIFKIDSQIRGLARACIIWGACSEPKSVPAGHLTPLMTEPL